MRWAGGEAAGAGDNSADALQKAQGGGASAIARIARELEAEAAGRASSKL